MTLALADAASAVALLSATRPHPKYSHWSEALYLNAQGFNMLHKYDRAAHYLEIAARTRSKAAPAEYARLILAKHLFMTKKYHEAQKYLKKINSLPAYYEKVKQWYAAAITLAMNATGDVTPLIEGIAPFAAQKDLIRALVRLLAERTIDSPKPLPRVTEIVKHLDASMKRPFLNWSWQLVNKSKLVQRKALATALCKLLTDLK